MWPGAEIGALAGVSVAYTDPAPNFFTVVRNSHLDSRESLLTYEV